jgi:acyl-CoA thioester hydrolase
LKKKPSHVSEYNFFSNLSTRWNDNDIYGHMNNIVYYALFDTAVNKWLISNKLIDIKNGKNIGLIVQSGCNYFSSFEYPEDIKAGIRVTKIGSSSVRYEVGLFKDKEEYSSADGFFVHVYVDRKTNKPISLDYDFKKTLDTIFVDLEN